MREARIDADVTCPGAPAKSPMPFNRERGLGETHDRRGSSFPRDAWRAERGRRSSRATRAFRGRLSTPVRSLGFFEVHAENYMKPAARRIAASTPFASATRCRSTKGWPIDRLARTARPGASATRLAAVAKALWKPVFGFPSISPGRPTRRRVLQRSSPPALHAGRDGRPCLRRISTRCRTPSGGPCCFRKSFGPMSSLPKARGRRRISCVRSRAPHRLRSLLSSTSATCS